MKETVYCKRTYVNGIILHNLFDSVGLLNVRRPASTLIGDQEHMPHWNLKGFDFSESSTSSDETDPQTSIIYCGDCTYERKLCQRCAKVDWGKLTPSLHRTTVGHCILRWQDQGFEQIFDVKQPVKNSDFVRDIYLAGFQKTKPKSDNDSSTSSGLEVTK